jgi:voltage-gated potassium channel
MKLPQDYEATFGDLYTQMKERHNATLIGYRAKGAQHPSINPPGATRIEGGELFYIASTRLKEISNGMV